MIYTIFFRKLQKKFGVAIQTMGYATSKKVCTPAKYREQIAYTGLDDQRDRGIEGKNNAKRKKKKKKEKEKRKKKKERQ